MNYSFLILNYNSFDDTIKCITSINALEQNASTTINIIVIDNNSPQGDYNKLQKYYSSDPSVLLYKMPYNMGFSAANNYGYLKVKDTNPDYCIICNSDIVFYQKDFLTKIDDEYKESGFYILGPDIIYPADKNVIHQSPQFPFQYKRNYIKKHCIKYLMHLGYKSKVITLSYFLWNIKNLFDRAIYAFQERLIYKKYKAQRHENVPIHGSCLVVSNSFIKHNEHLFYPETRFYGEEILLFLRMKEQKSKIVYSPKLSVYHMQGRSTSTIDSDSRDYFVWTNLVMSDFEILRKMATEK